MAELLQDRRQGHAARQPQADAAVAGQIAGTGQDQIAGTGQPEEGPGPSSQPDPEAGDLRQTPGDQGGARRQPQAQSIANARRDSDDILDRATDFDADQVVARVEPQTRAVQRPRRGFGKGGVGRRQGDRGRQPARDFIGEARAGQRTAGGRRIEDLVRHFMGKARGTGFEALAKPQHRNTRDRRERRQRRPQRCRGGRDHGKIGVAYRAGKIRFDRQGEGQRKARQQCAVLAIHAQRLAVPGAPGPERHGVAVGQADRECRAPGTRAEDRDLHRPQIWSLRK